MGNSCKCTSKVNLKGVSRRQTHSKTEITKRRQSKSHRWEVISKLYSSYPNPFEAFKSKKPSKFFQYLFEGPPAELRWDIWKAVFSINSKKVQLDLSENQDSHSIEKDLTRTFPTHPFFLVPSSQQALKNVLTSMVNNHPELGYCQGMNSLAGILLIESKGNELESYAVLESICYNLGGIGLFEYGFPLVVDLCEEFHKSLSEKLPSLHTLFEDMELDDNLWITKWFMTIFSYSFHLDCVLRIWDAIFAYGLGFMVNIALGLVSYLKQDLIDKSLSDMLEYLPELKEIYVDVDAVLYHSANFKVKSSGRVRFEEDLGSETLQEEVESHGPILTKWVANKKSHRHSISMAEEFSRCSSESSKFSM